MFIAYGRMYLISVEIGNFIDKPWIDNCYCVTERGKERFKVDGVEYPCTKEKAVSLINKKLQSFYVVKSNGDQKQNKHTANVHKHHVQLSIFTIPNRYMGASF